MLGSGKSSLEGNPFGIYAPLTWPVSSVTLSLSVRAWSRPDKDGSTKANGSRERRNDGAADAVRETLDRYRRKGNVTQTAMAEARLARLGASP